MNLLPLPPLPPLPPPLLLAQTRALICRLRPGHQDHRVGLMQEVVLLMVAAAAAAAAAAPVQAWVEIGPQGLGPVLNRFSYVVCVSFRSVFQLMLARC